MARPAGLEPATGRLEVADSRLLLAAFRCFSIVEPGILPKVERVWHHLSAFGDGAHTVRNGRNTVRT